VELAEIVIVRFSGAESDLDEWVTVLGGGQKVG
jgi:hypothetical protein